MTPADLHMAHLKRYGPQLNDNIEKVAIFFQNWGPSSLWSQPIQDRVPQKSCFRAFFLENHFFDSFRPNEDPQVLYMAGKLWVSSFWWYKERKKILILQSVRFSMTVRTDIFLYTEKLSVTPFLVQINCLYWNQKHLLYFGVCSKSSIWDNFTIWMKDDSESKSCSRQREKPALLAAADNYLFQSS